jgi:hypothetical protein
MVLISDARRKNTGTKIRSKAPLVRVEGVLQENGLEQLLDGKG